MKARILVGDCLTRLRALPDASVHCCVTSPPYWGLRDYGAAGQIGLEPTPEEYVARMVEVFREVRRVLREDGTLWLNLGDSYAGGGGYAPGAPCNQRWADGDSWGAMNPFTAREGAARVKPKPGYTPPGLKPKDLVGIPWRVAFALQADGWWLRSDIIWAKPNPMPESVTDRPTKAHEYVFLLTKSARYWYDADAIRDPHSHPDLARIPDGPGGSYQVESGRNDGGRHTNGRGFASDPDAGRNARTVWTIATQPYAAAHFAVMAPALAERCILAGCPEGGTVLDPFGGAGTTGLVATGHGRDAVLVELNPQYADLARARIAEAMPLLTVVEVDAVSPDAPRHPGS